MRYAMLLKPHPNVRYRQSLHKLALIELQCVLKAWGLEDARPSVSSIQGEPFLLFETENMTDEAWRALSRHSGICLACEASGETLRPLGRERAGYLSEDLSEVLKYKGKTNADFTLMMLHCAKAASAFARESRPLLVLDPLCGKGTTLFCALEEGNDAVGVEVDAKALAETDAYFERFLQLHRLKYQRKQSSLTLGAGKSAKMVEYAVAQSAESMKRGDARGLRLINGDARQLKGMVSAESCDLLVSDLPYGVQHAPRAGHDISSLPELARALAPACARALCKGGAAALSFNAHTLRRAELAQLMSEAGLCVLDAPPYDDFRHWVEQAVDRDVLVAVKN